MVSISEENNGRIGDVLVGASAHRHESASHCVDQRVPHQIDLLCLPIISPSSGHAADHIGGSVRGHENSEGYSS